MTEPVNQRHLVDAITCTRILLEYEVVMGETPDPANIFVRFQYVQGSGAEGHTSESLVVPFNSLPVGAQNAINQLYQFGEQEIVAYMNQ